MNCKYCNCDYNNKLEHMSSLTHQTNESNYYLLQRKNKDDSEYKQRENVIAEYKEYIEYNDFNCMKCDFHSEVKELMIQHEESCLGIKVNRVESLYNCLECSDCGFIVQIKGQKMKPKYIMNAHKKKCHKMMIKKQRAYIKENLKSATDAQIKTIFKLIKQN